MNKTKKTILIAIFVSLAAQIRINFLTEGFIVAMSILVMTIFLYCYDDLSPRQVAFCSGVFSPLFRMALEVAAGASLMDSVPRVIPDMAFFFTYGVLYPVIYQRIMTKPRDLRNFTYVILICDWCSNIMEILVRSMVIQQNLITVQNLSWLLLIAVIRTALIQIILIAVETHSNLLIQEEHDKDYKKLLIQASIFEGELHVMEKNVAEIEGIMRQAFRLYTSINESNGTLELKKMALDISKNAHEIKGDYLNIIQVLQDTLVGGVEESQMLMSEIVSIEKTNLQSVMKTRGYQAEVVTRVKTDFAVKHYFEMMSILRNLMLNGAEAVGVQSGKITVTVSEEEGESSAYLLSVRDTGSGISEENLETVFYDGFSTKFDSKTGDVQRGIGLTLVKDYVETVFKGTIAVSSIPRKYTEFVVTLPQGVFKEEKKCSTTL